MRHVSSHETVYSCVQNSGLVGFISFVALFTEKNQVMFLVCGNIPGQRYDSYWIISLDFNFDDNYVAMYSIRKSQLFGNLFSK